MELLFYGSHMAHRQNSPVNTITDYRKLFHHFTSDALSYFPTNWNIYNSATVKPNIFWCFKLNNKKYHSLQICLFFLHSADMAAATLPYIGYK